MSGPITIACGFIVMAILPPVPEKVKFGFTKQEKEMAVQRSQEAFNTTDAKVKPKQLLAMVKDPKTYFYSKSVRLWKPLFDSRLRQPPLRFEN